MLRKNLLDKGYLELLETFGDELTIVNAARVSFGAKKDNLSEGDVKLIKYLYDHEHMCYDDKTEIFTNKGWMTFPDFYNDNEVMPANVYEDGRMTYSSPLIKNRYSYQGDMYLIDNSSTNICVTPNHQMYVCEKNSTFQKVEMSELENKKFRVMNNALLVTKNKNPLDYQNGYTDSYIFLEEREKELERIISARYIPVSQLPVKEIPEKIFEKSCSYRVGFMDGLLDRLKKTRGGYYKFDPSNCWELLEQSSDSREFLSSIVRLATTLNIPARMITNNKNYFLDLSFPNPWIDKSQKVNYSGYVYCCTVPTGLLLVRRDNKFPIVCGNSPFRHLMFRFRIKMPEFVARQMYKHTIGCEVTSTHPVRDTAWNELCLSGDIDIKFSPFTIKLETLYKKFIENAEEVRSWDLVVFDEERRTNSLSRITNMYRRGINNVYSLSLNNGRVLRCTMNHKILTDLGWMSLREIDVSKSRGIPVLIETEGGLSGIISIKYLDTRECYDISVDGVNDNFFANGIVVHNSGRYKPIVDYYYPEEWRLQSLNNKQGSEGELNDIESQKARNLFEGCMDNIKSTYSDLLNLGVAKEQARIILPLNMYTEVVWTCSAQAALHFIELRDKPDSQYEIRVYAEAMKEMIKEKFPTLTSVWFDK